MNLAKSLAIGFAIFYGWHLLASIVDRKFPAIRKIADGI